MSLRLLSQSLALPFVLGLAAFACAGPLPSPPPSATPPSVASGVDLQVQLIDDSTMKLKLLDEKLELTTKHGVLRIAMADVRRIEFATRTPPEVQKRVADAVAKLGHPDSMVRDKASAELLELGSRAFASVGDATNSGDAEVARRAVLLVGAIQKRVPAGNLKVNDKDIVYTDDSKISGTLAANSLRVRTFAFGEQVLRVADLRSVGPSNAAKAEIVAQPGPPNLSIYQGQSGVEMSFTVTGSNAGVVWGSDKYTLDSTLASAAVHAGKLHLGQTAVVHVRIIPPPAQFAGEARNGIASNPFGQFPAGAFEFIEK